MMRLKEWFPRGPCVSVLHWRVRNSTRFAEILAQRRFAKKSDYPNSFLRSLDLNTAQTVIVSNGARSVHREEYDPAFHF